MRTTSKLPSGVASRRRAGDARSIAPLIAALTFATGTLDVASLAVLGSAFTSVMTGNLVFLGLSIGNGSAQLALHTGTAVIGYVLGGLLGSTLLDRFHDGRQVLWPRAVTATLAVEVVTIAVLAGSWWATDGRPRGTGQDAMLLLAAATMGIQSAAVRGIGVPVSTTYMTGTLTALIASLTARRERRQPVDRNAVVALVSLVTGAAVASWFLVHARLVVPLLPLSALTVVVAARRATEPAGSPAAVTTG